MKLNKRFNIRSFLLMIVLMAGAIIILVASGFMIWDPEGILAGFVFFTILAFIGYLIEKLGIEKYFR